MEKTKRIARLILRNRPFASLTEGITDIRKNPSIALRTILTTVVLMPFFSLTSLLSLDREARTQQFKALFGCPRALVVSDSTVRRVLGWLNPTQLRRRLLALLPGFEAKGLLTRCLVPEGSIQRIGILDGSYMGGHWLSMLLLCGTINAPALIAPRVSQGDELRRGMAVMRASRALLGPCFPTLWLLDALYFTRPVFRLLRRQGAQLLIKCKDAEFREITQDAANLFQHFGGDRRAEGFDSARMCSWRLHQTTAAFAGIPVQVLKLSEHYPKRRREQHVDCWIVTTDLALSLPEAREAAHLRWQIENNLFKRLNHLCGTKRFRFKDPRAFFNWLHLMSATVAVLDALTTSLAHHRLVFKHLLGGSKFTWRNLFSRLVEAWEGPLFAAG